MAKTPQNPAITKKHLARLERERIQRKYLLIGSLIVLVAAIGVVVYGVMDQTILKKNKPVAQVGSVKISVKEFEKRVKFSRTQLIQQYNNYAQLMQMFGADSTFSQSIQSSLDQIVYQLSPENANSLGSSVLEQLIAEEIMAREAKARGITVSDAEIEEVFRTAFAFFPDGTPTPTITPTQAVTSTLNSMQRTLLPPTATVLPAVTETMETGKTVTPTMPPAPTPTIDPNLPTETPFPTSTPYTLEGFQGEVNKYLEELKPIAMDETDLRHLVYMQILRQKLYDQITADVKPEEEQVWARHILVADETAAEIVRERLNRGENWVTLAAELSQDTSNKDRGGDLGWFGKGKMVKEFEDAAFAQEIGEIGKPVKTQFGWHIIQVLGHELRPLTSAEFSNLKDDVFQKWIDEQSQAEDIKRFDIWQNVIPTEPNLGVG